MTRFKYGLIAVSQSEKDRESERITVNHFCGYETPPTDFDKTELEKELNTDPEFGLIGRINKDVFIITAPEEMVKFYTNQDIDFGDKQ